MKKTTQARRLILDKTTVRVLSTNDLRDVVGGTIGDPPPPTWTQNVETCRQK